MKTDLVKFKCTKCGICCKSIVDISTTNIMDNVLGLYLSPEEIIFFPKECVYPLYALDVRNQVPSKIIAYQLGVQICPNYKGDIGCIIYPRAAGEPLLFSKREKFDVQSE